MREMSAAEAGLWEYRGEGAANIVLSYRGQDPSLVGKILRIRKVPPSPAAGPEHPLPSPPPVAGLSQSNADVDATSLAPPLARHPVLTPSEQDLWSDLPMVAEATTSADLARAYVRQVMAPLLGDEHVDPGSVVHMGPDFLHAVAHTIHGQRPESRKREGGLALIPGQGLIISDHSRFHDAPPGTSNPPPPTICIEIKPKCGFLPTADTILEANRIKCEVPRFQMHQHLKVAQGKVNTVSDYNPLQLFSGSKEELSHALVSLLSTPQNNIRVFRDGTEVPISSCKLNHLPHKQGEKTKLDGEQGRQGADTAVLGEAMEGFVNSNRSMEERVRALLERIKIALSEGSVLERLLAAQKLDAKDVEGAIVAYERLLSFKRKREGVESGGEGVVVGGGDEAREKELARIRGMAKEECRQVVRDFLTAATAKDCGIMIAMQIWPKDWKREEWLGTRHTVAVCPITGEFFRYKVSFVDLDMKSLQKMPQYFSLDQKIVKHYIDAVRWGQAQPT